MPPASAVARCRSLQTRKPYWRLVLPASSPKPIAPHRRLALIFLFAFPALLFAVYLAYPRTKKPCPSACIAFMGDSITSWWPALQPPNQFSGLQIVNRGLPGDTTFHMVSRFRPDVIQMRPRVVVILGGLNDLARTPLPIIEQNLAAMCQTAREHKIQVILATLPPARAIWANNSQPLASTQSAENDVIAALNTWIRSFAAQNHYTLLDYYSVLSDERGGYRGGLTTDGIHLTPAGYARMEPLLREAIQSALK
jgi:lysophospholipase L1-like esterase